MRQFFPNLIFLAAMIVAVIVDNPIVTLITFAAIGVCSLVWMVIAFFMLMKVEVTPGELHVAHMKVF